MSEAESSNIDNNDILKILIATDIHLGYLEKDPIRTNDSFLTFEEILSHAVQNDVDFILLGGDLFHDANPSQYTIQKCLKLLRTYTLGSKAIEIEFLSDQNVNFAETFNKTVNYNDPNMNVSYPVFSIHGNHDDPSGFGRISSLDLLSTVGLVNYFGKWTDLKQIKLHPILLRKGETQFALYGLSHINDMRLARLFENSKVTFEQPSSDTGKWFNMFVLHQNRAPNRGPKNFLPEEILPEFLDLILWGHEHECKIFAEQNPKTKFYVTQPGSSVATSLCQGESISKHIGLLHIHKEQFKLEEIQLKTVRPFVFKTVILSEMIVILDLGSGGNVSGKVEEYVTNIIEDMIQESTKLWTDDELQPRLPLIRLNLQYSEERQMFNTIRFGQRYDTRVANYLDMIKFNRKGTRVKYECKDFDKEAMDEAFMNAAGNQQNDLDDDPKIEDIVERYFTTIGADGNKSMTVLSSKSMSELCRRLMNNRDDDAAERIIEYQKHQAIDYLMEQIPDETNVKNELQNFSGKFDEIYDGILKMLDERGAKKSKSTISATAASSSTSINSTNNKRSIIDSDNDFIGDDDNDDDNVFGDSYKMNQTTGRGGGGRGRGKGSRGGRGATKSTVTNNTGRGRRGGGVAAAAAITTTTTVSQSSIKKAAAPIAPIFNSSRRITRTNQPVSYIDFNDSD